MAIYDVSSSSLLKSVFDSKGNHLERAYNIKGVLILGSESNGATKDISEGSSAQADQKS